MRTLLPTALGQAMCANLSAEIEQLAWAGGDAVAALLAPGNVVVVHPTAGKNSVRPLALPPASTWQRPPPLDEKGKPRLGADPSDKTHLFTRGGEVWLARCPWWIGFDAGQCHEWVSVRLDPSPGIEVSHDDPPGYREPPPSALGGVAPPDVHITAAEPSPGKPPSLACERGGQRGVFQPELRGEGTHITVSWSWVPDSMDRYLATATYDYGEAVHTYNYQMKACASKPLQEDVIVIAGPRSF